MLAARASMTGYASPLHKLPFDEDRDIIR